MRIVAFSDLHRDRDAARAIVAMEADVVVGAGDFATRGEGAADTLDILRGLHCPFVLVHGNHDDPAELPTLVEGWPDAHVLHGRGVRIGGVDFYGIGGETPIRNSADWNAGQDEAESARLLGMCPPGAILVSHSPPLGHCDGQRDGSSEGSAALLRCVEETRPRHVLCGHIHHSWSSRSTLGPTAIYNIGPKAIALDLA